MGLSQKIKKKKKDDMKVYRAKIQYRLDVTREIEGECNEQKK